MFELPPIFPIPQPLEGFKRFIKLLLATLYPPGLSPTLTAPLNRLPPTRVAPLVTLERKTCGSGLSTLAVFEPPSCPPDRAMLRPAAPEADQHDP